MAKIYKDKPEKGPLELLLESKDPEEIKKEKAKEFHKVSLTSIVDGDVEITILNKKLKETGVEFIIAVKQNGLDVDLKDFNPFTIVNPPLMVPDGTFRKEMINGPDGQKEIEIENMKEDSEESLKQILVQTVRGVI